MKRYTLFFFFLLSITLSAQVYEYTPFPKETGYWKYKVKDGFWQWTGQWAREEYKAQGDTMHSPGEGAYYEANKKIYYRPDTSNVFKVLYDFNLTVGDTFVNPFFSDQNWVDSIGVVIQDDSLGFYNGVQRRSISLASESFYHTWIEGVGNPSYNGIKYNLHMGTLSGGWEFSCMYADSTSYFCPDAYILDQPELPKQNPAVYPNPVKDILTVSGLTVNTKIQLIDISGKTISIENKLKGDKLHLTNLPKGVYFLKIDHSNEVISKKIIKL